MEKGKMDSVDPLKTIDLVKILVPAAITLFIAAIGWILTNRYNNTQLAIAERKNEADLEVAKVNAALDYLKVVAAIPKEDASQRRQALAVAAPVLPTEMAFDLAVRNLADDSGPLSLLLRKHGDDSWGHLVRFLEAPPRDSEVGQARLQLPNSPSLPEAVPAPNEELQHALAGALLTYLDRERYLEPFYAYLLGPKYHRIQLRPYSLLYYYRYRNSQGNYATPGPSENLRNQALVQSALKDPELPPDTKAAIALAGCLAFASGYGDLGDQELMREAADRFWIGLDIASGETPEENDIRSLVYRRRFTYGHGDVRVSFPETLERVSASLQKELIRLDLKLVPITRVTTLLYAYSESSPRESPTPFTAYLLPQQSLALVKASLEAANTPARRRELAMHFGSLSGSILFRNISQDRSVGHRFADALLSWYRAWYQPDWYPPKFFWDVAEAYPELAPDLRQQPWERP